MLATAAGLGTCRVNMAIRLARAAAWLCLTAGLLQASALAHDSGMTNGVFRSRDGGATWLQVNPESFAPGALALAVHPRDANHLLLATDSGLLGSHNGGRDWQPEAANVLSGPAFAVAFDLGGDQALACGANALYRFDGNRWREARTPAGSAPARALVPGGVAGRAYLAGWTGLHRTDNWGRSWTRVGHEIGAEPVSALTVSPLRADEVHALAAGRVWRSTDGARNWRVDESAPQRVEALAFDRAPLTRLWLVAAGRVHRQNDRAARWEPVGAPLPDAQAVARGIDVANDAMLVVTDRGVFRSDDAGASWALLSAELPNHSEASLLVRDAHALALYVGFSRIGPQQLKSLSSATGSPVASGDIALLVAAYAGFALLLLGTGVIVRRLTRAGTTATQAEHSIPLQAQSPP
jgi:photosystem II stability/assembly factor-like uncharacterized protein